MSDVIKKGPPNFFWFAVSMSLVLVSITFCYLAVRATTFKIGYDGAMIELERSSTVLNEDAENLISIVEGITDPEVYASDYIGEEEDVMAMEEWPEADIDINDETIIEPQIIQRRIAPKEYKEELEGIRNRSMRIQETAQQSLKR